MPSSNFRPTQCLADGQLTPPDSPDVPNKAVPFYGYRLQWAKWLRRAKTENDHPQLPVRTFGSSRPSVRNMTAPFPFVLPDSPVDSDASSVFSNSPTTSPGLRRRSPTYNDLRSLAARQKEALARRVDSPLLPSPVIKDNHIQSDSFFTFCNPRPARPETYRSYEDLHILSDYCDDAAASKAKNYADAVDCHHDSISEDSLVLEGDDSRSTSSDEEPTTPNDGLYRINTYRSDESGWLANETSCTERKRKFHARCVQVFPCSDGDKHTVCSQIMVAALAGHRRPKLVHISRPSSRDGSIESGQRRMAYMPQTPPRTLEISKFSPDDTPDSPRQPESPYLTPYPNKTSTESIDNYRFSATSLVPPPLMPRVSPSNRSASTVYSCTLDKLAELSDPFGVSPQRKTSSEADPNASDWTIPTNAWPIPPDNDLHKNHPPPSRRLTLDFITSLEIRIRQLRQNIASVTAAINTFPNGILRLDSPPVGAIRASHIPDSTYIETLEKIFPRASKLLLSALAAWLIVDLWFEHTIVSSTSCGKDDELTAEDILHSQHTTDFWTQPHQPTPPLSVDFSHGLQSPEMESYVSYAWDANSPLRRIPIKARSLLGISESTLLNERLLKAHEAALIRRMRVLRPSINAVGQRLLVALRGAWDEDVWRCLRVMVEVIEESPAATGLGLAS